MRLLLALMLLASPATGVTFTEPNNGTGFGDTFAARTLLPGDVDEVTGYVWGAPSSPPWERDWFAFTGLEPGTPFTITFQCLWGDGGVSVSIVDAARHPMFSGDDGPYDDRGITFTGIVPDLGELVLYTAPDADNGAYRVTLIPEPATALMMLCGLTILALRRQAAQAPPD